MIYRSNLSAIIILLHFYLCFSVSGAQSENYRLAHIVSASQSFSSNDNTNTLIELLSPFGGEYFLKETKINIKWETSLIDKIEIKFSSDGGEKWSIIQSNIDSKLGSIKWTIPDIQSTQCKIKICSQSENTNQVTSCNFTIGDQSKLPGIVIDEEFEDWNILSNIAQIIPGEKSGKTLKAFNDDDFLYIYFETEKVLSLQNNNSITLYIDTDNKIFYLDHSQFIVN